MESALMSLRAIAGKLQNAGFKSHPEDAAEILHYSIAGQLG
jgi:hypothetical protein